MLEKEQKLLTKQNKTFNLKGFLKLSISSIILSSGLYAVDTIQPVDFNKYPLPKKLTAQSRGGDLPDKVAATDGIGSLILKTIGKNTDKLKNDAYNKIIYSNINKLKNNETINDLITNGEIIIDSNILKNVNNIVVNNIELINGKYTSCKEILNSGNSYGNGVYILKINNIEESVYCDMTTDGGGWTLVALQFENSPVTDWNKGIDPDNFNPLDSFNNSVGFVLSSSQLPPDRTETAFGKDLDPTYVDYVQFIYTTGNISTIEVISPKTGKHYQIDRNFNYSYHYGNPEESKDTTNYMWHNVLTFDETNGRKFTWQFVPRINIKNKRGYNLKGEFLVFSDESFAWSVWVR